MVLLLFLEEGLIVEGDGLVRDDDGEDDGAADEGPEGRPFAKGGEDPDGSDVFEEGDEPDVCAGDVLRGFGEGDDDAGHGAAVEEGDDVGQGGNEEGLPEDARSEEGDAQGAGEVADGAGADGVDDLVREEHVSQEAQIKGDGDAGREGDQIAGDGGRRLGALPLLLEDRRQKHHNHSAEGPDEGGDGRRRQDVPEERPAEEGAPDRIQRIREHRVRRVGQKDSERNSQRRQALQHREGHRVGRIPHKRFPPIVRRHQRIRQQHQTDGQQLPKQQREVVRTQDPRPSRQQRVRRHQERPDEGDHDPAPRIRRGFVAPLVANDRAPWTRRHPRHVQGRENPRQAQVLLRVRHEHLEPVLRLVVQQHHPRRRRTRRRRTRCRSLEPRRSHAGQQPPLVRHASSLGCRSFG
mmetsp:Transcript_19745/g.63494  ORF Transcript_19745/g.63494 Transcript_19745/m.63494 type:complete len:408 (+) Transcript_19745:121-1344(+)